jgi:hypothetical protein
MASAAWPSSTSKGDVELSRVGGADGIFDNCQFRLGTANIRAAKSYVNAGMDLAVEPQTIEFDGRPQLANRMLLPANDETQAVFGDNVSLVDPTEARNATPFVGLVVEKAADGAHGRASRLLLAHILSILARDHQFVAGDARWRALVATPIAGQPDVGPGLETRLREAGFVDVKAYDSALAALAYYAGDRPHGLYVVIDLGAAETRLAAVEARSDSTPVILASARGAPGGRNFDRVLFDYFRPQLEPMINGEEFDPETRALIEGFKRDFSRAWAEGNSQFSGYSGICRVGSDPVTLAMDYETFLSQSVAGPLIDRFRQNAGDFVDKHTPGGNLSGLILVGGGANWPFVIEWAEAKVGREHVMINQYPEEVVVRGLPHLVSGPAPIVEQPAVEPDQPPDRRERRPPTPARKTMSPTMSPGRAFALEFVGGLVGFLGLGWFFGRRQVPIGCLALVGWWIVLISLFVLGVYSAAVDQPLRLLGLAALWLGVPFLSAFILSRRMTS